MQILTILSTPTAPISYPYDIGLPDGASMRKIDEGAVEIIGKSGEFLGGIAPAWAKDANGVQVPTRYEISGSTLTQFVDHRSSSFVYPIVADPCLGIDLYNQPYVTFQKEGYKINVTPTPWGVANAGPATWWAHRDEVKTKLGGNAWRWTNSIQEQFYCRIAGLPLSLPQYNMESWRPVIGWAQSLAQYRCNPYDGKWSQVKGVLVWKLNMNLWLPNHHLFTTRRINVNTIKNQPTDCHWQFNDRGRSMRCFCYFRISFWSIYVCGRS